MKFSMLKSVVAAAAMSLALLAAPVASHAQESPSAVLDSIRSSGILKVPVMIGEEPGYIKDPTTGKWGGFYYDFLGDIAEILGVKLQPVETTWGNLAADFQANKIDIAIAVNPNPKRGLVIDYVWAALFSEPWAVLTPKGKPAKTWAELNDASKTIVVQKGSTMQVVAEALLPKAKITPVEDRGQALLELQSGRTDGVILAMFDAMTVKTKNIGDVSVPEPILRSPATLAVARKSGNAGYINFLTNWVEQQRSLGIAQGRLAKAWASQGIDLSSLPPGIDY